VSVVVAESGRGFPPTAWSLVLKLGTEEARRGALDRLFRTYHAPVLAHLRRTWPAKPFEAIEDLAGGFFLHLVEKADFSRYDPARSRFRTFLKMMLNGYARDEYDRETSLKEGGSVRKLPFEGDRSQLERFLADRRTLSPEEILDAVVRDELIQKGVEKLRAWAEATGRFDQFQAFRLFALENDEGRTHAEVARLLNLNNEQQAKNFVSWMRDRLRHEIRELLKPGVEDPGRDLDVEYQELFGTP
jgi:hypothetical protein